MWVSLDTQRLDGQGLVFRSILIVEKTQKRVYIFVFGTWIAILGFISSMPLNFATSYDLGCLSVSERSIISPWNSKGLINVTCMTILTISENIYIYIYIYIYIV